MSCALELLSKQVTASSSAVFQFDSWKIQCNSWPIETESIFQLSSRSGSSAALIGFLRAQGPKSSADVKPIAILATPSNLQKICSALEELPKDFARPAISILVACSEPSLAAKADDHVDMQLQPNIGHVLSTLATFDDFDPVVMTSGGSLDGAQSILDCALAAVELAKAGKDVIHAFDAIAAGREHRVNLNRSDTTAMQDVDYQVADIVTQSLGSVKHFSASVPAEATTVIVLPSSLHSSYALAAQASLSRLKDVGIIVATVLRPWSSEELLESLPASVKQVSVYTENRVAGTNSLLHQVMHSVRTSKTHRHIRVRALAQDKEANVHSWIKLLLSHSTLPGDGSVKPESLLAADSKLAVFWSSDSGKTANLAEHLWQQFASQNDVSPRLYTEYDNFSGKDCGLKRSVLLLSPAKSSAPGLALAALLQTASPDLLFLSGPASIIASYNPFDTIGMNTQVVFASSSWAPEEYAAKLSLPNKAALVAKSNINQIWTLDVAKVVADSGLIASDGLIEEAAFWHFYIGQSPGEKEAVATISSLLNTSPAGGEWSQDSFDKLIKHVRAGLQHVMLPKEGEGQPPAAAEADTASPQAIAPLPTDIICTSAQPNAHKAFAEPLPVADRAWHQIAKQLLFQEAFEVDLETLRPDLTESNYILTVTENKRLTPLEYDRNVFHMELSTEGTGLKYAVGEALGVHGWNDGEEVAEFIQWFGLDADALVRIPARENSSAREFRSVFQTLQQNLDIFGKPTKSFYEALSKCSPNREESRHLRFVSSAEGSSTFRKMAEDDTVTYVDVLKAFPLAAASLGLDGLLREVPLIKPRHYSIASSQNFVGDSVHLLVVTVDWMTPAEQRRFGQCTRYLAGLNIGDKVTVSVKPSVMKLPPKDTQPIIMAGLGTGAAPFRAFLQERQYQREQGLEIGPCLYYFGSRYSSKEFLYGEEIKAWLSDGLLTHAGLAFSRDTNKKVYIQHKMQEDGKVLDQMMKDGVFYLCGPTWPVPDVHEALCQSLVQHSGMKHEDADKHLEALKEEERYVLEVY